MTPSDGRRGAMEWMPHVVAAAAVAVTVGLQDSADATLLVLGFCVPAIVCARLLESVYLGWRRGGYHRAVGCLKNPRFHPPLLVLGFCALVIFLVVIVKEPDLSERLRQILELLERAAVTSALLAVVFELAGTSRAELAAALSANRTGYSEGAAWLFFLGYLEKSFGDEARHFAARMEDYLASHNVPVENRRNTCQAKMFILLPMTLAVDLSDTDLHRSDPRVTKEQSLGRANCDGPRNFGETHVYRVRLSADPRHDYRLTMEVATALRTAHRAMDDSDAAIDGQDYDTFASQFYDTLSGILQDKQTIAAQLELVPVYRGDQIGETVVRRFLELNGREGELEGQAQEQRQAAGFRQPEEGSEMDSASWR